MTYTEKDQQYKRYTVTSALPYANGPVHIGHLARSLPQWGQVPVM